MSYCGIDVLENRGLSNSTATPALPLPPAEQRMSLAADERKREFHEEKRQEFENYAEEERDGRALQDRTKSRRGKGISWPRAGPCSCRTRRAEQGEHRAVEGVSLRRAVSSPGVQSPLHLRPRRAVKKTHRDSQTRLLVSDFCFVLNAINRSKCWMQVVMQDWTLALGQQLTILVTFIFIVWV